MGQLREKVWIWGHPENSLKGHYGLVKDSNVTPIDGMKYLGARNIFYVPMSRPCNKDEKSIGLQENCISFGWSKEIIDDIDDIIERKKKFASFNILIYDDFFQTDNEGNNAFCINKEKLLANKKKLNDNGLEMWVVFYERDKDIDISEYLDCFDGISFWFWNQPSEEQYQETIKMFIAKTPNKKRLVGCYLYDFGREKECDADRVEAELENNKKLLQEGLIEGFILHTNVVGDMGFEAYERCAKWMQKNGDIEI